ncbi:MAG: DinB family protein [Saprospiraceae bacterium]|nr:DinB family protein [Saprospiraceae bacterium]MDZ4704062.1 DinB family protein [Saprospiraceae bacterium]
MEVQDKEQLITAIGQQFDAFADLIRQWPDATFETMPEGKWSAGQQLDHLIRSVKPVNLALRLPGWLLRVLFGKPNRASRTYAGLVEKYLQKLNAGGVASGPFVPPAIPLARKQPLLGVYNREAQRLMKIVNRWQDADLDHCLLPHPLLGKLTLREMLFFTIYHIGHHQRLLEQRVTPVV